MNAQNHYNQQDQQLVEMVLKGDAQAFARIIKNTERLVAQVVFKMIRNTEDRKDIAQDVYLKAYKNLSGFRFEAKLSTWIAQIAYNTCLGWLEKKKLILSGDLESFHAIPDDTIIKNKNTPAIIAASIERLSPVFKTLITLYHQEEMSYAEIVGITGLPEGSVKSYLFRARKSLKDDLLRHYKKEEL